MTYVEFIQRLESTLGLIQSLNDFLKVGKL